MLLLLDPTLKSSIIIIIIINIVVVTGTSDLVNAIDKEPDVVTETDDRSIPPTDQTSMTSSPSPASVTTTPAASASTPCQETTMTTTTWNSITPFVGAVQGPVVNVYSPFIEDQREVTPGPNVFEENMRNAIDLREHEDTTGANDQQNGKKKTGIYILQAIKKRKIDLNYHSPFNKFIIPLFLSRLFLVLILCILLFLSLHHTALPLICLYYYYSTF